MGRMESATNSEERGDVVDTQIPKYVEKDPVEKERQVSALRSKLQHPQARQREFNDVSAGVDENQWNTQEEKAKKIEEASKEASSTQGHKRDSHEELGTHMASEVHNSM